MLIFVILITNNTFAADIVDDIADKGTYILPEVDPENGTAVSEYDNSFDDPFQLMYDSDEKLAETIEELPALREELNSRSALERNGFMAEDVYSLGLSLEYDNTELMINNIIQAATEKDIAKIRMEGFSTELESQIIDIIQNSGENRYIVKYKNDNFGSLISKTHVSGMSMEIGAFTELITFDERVNPKELADELRGSKIGEQIEYIQPDFGLIVDSLGLEMSGLGTFGQDPGYGAADEYNTLIGNAVKVAVIDTGVDVTHPILFPYLSGGWNFIANNDTLYNPDDPLSAAHGTHVSSIIAQTAAQYGSNIEILPLRVFENGIAYTSDIIAAIAYADAQGAAVINCSFGSTDENPALYDAIASSNALFVVAVGNSRRDLSVTPSYPAAYRLDNLISVASVNADGGFSYFVKL